MADTEAVRVTALPTVPMLKPTAATVALTMTTFSWRVATMRLTLPWWPRKSTHDVWEMPIVVRNCVLAKLIPGYEVTEG